MAGSPIYDPKLLVVRPPEEGRPIPLPRVLALRFPFRKPSDEHLLGPGIPNACLVLRNLGFTSCSLMLGTVLNAVAKLLPSTHRSSLL